MENSLITVRQLEDTDLGEWLRLRRLLWDETPESEHEEEMVDVIEHPETQFVSVADIGGGKLVAFLEASIRPWVEDCEGDMVGYLEGWYVEPNYRRQGLGRHLVSEAEAWARSKGCGEMASDAEIGNETSIEAHRQLGYEETSRLVHLRKALV